MVGWCVPHWPIFLYPDWFPGCPWPSFPFRSCFWLTAHQVRQNSPDVASNASSLRSWPQWPRSGSIQTLFLRQTLCQSIASKTCKLQQYPRLQPILQNCHSRLICLFLSMYFRREWLCPGNLTLFHTQSNFLTLSTKKPGEKMHQACHSYLQYFFETCANNWRTNMCILYVFRFLFFNSSIFYGYHNGIGSSQISTNLSHW